MIVLAQATDRSIWDNIILDQWEIPFGAWMDQAVDWIDSNLGWLLNAIEWPFNTLIGAFVNDFLAEISWIWVVLGMGLIAALARNIKVGVFVAVALTVCGILGSAYWIETARTIGFIAVAVLLCVIIGIPIGIVAGRVDGVWQVVRPILDAMQVVHSFVYMLPFIFFWGIGEVSATMVTMIFALPPLIRLTNLGVRQVPDDVVEASRAYGAPEWRVLFDVQLPLARPAIMTGINQTLLLAISMLGIAAIMGAGGLGRLLFRALSNQDVALAASGGLAFFLVAVVLDRISQREDTDTGNLFHRIRMAWAHRRDPEKLLEGVEVPQRVEAEVRYAAITSRERLPMALTLLGGILAVVSVYLPWTADAGKMSAYGRREDQDLAGSVFSGLDASGGSYFGIVVLAVGLFLILAVVVAYLRPGRGPRWLAADGALIAAPAGLLVALSHFLAPHMELALDPGTGIGVWLAIIGTALATVGALLWTAVAPHTPLHPLSADVSWGRMVGVGIAVVVIFVGAISGWAFDGRQDVVISPELQAEIERLQQEAVDNPAEAGPIAAELSALMAQARASRAIVADGITADGPQLGLYALLVAIAAAITTLPAIGVFGRDEHKQWFWSALTAGLGMGVAAIGFGWIFTHVRSADPNYVSGIGAFLVMSGGVFLLASTMSVLKEFRRSKVYGDVMQGELPVDVDAVGAIAADVDASVGVSG